MKAVLKRIVVIALALTVVFTFLPDFGVSEAYAKTCEISGTVYASTLASGNYDKELWGTGYVKLIMDKDLEITFFESTYGIKIVNKGTNVHVLKLTGEDAHIGAKNITVDGVKIVVDKGANNNTSYAIQPEENLIIKNSNVSITSCYGISVDGNFEITNSSLSVTSKYNNGYGIYYGAGIITGRKPLEIQNSNININMIGSNSCGIKAIKADISFTDSDVVINAEGTNSCPINSEKNVTFSKSDVTLSGGKTACLAKADGLIVKSDNYIKVPSEGKVVSYSSTQDAIGNSSGSAVKKASISRKYLSDISAPDMEYTGNRIRPVVVKWNGTTLTEDKGYTITYSNNLNVGKAKATITGIGNYSGKVVKYFKINPKGTSLLTPAPLSKAVKVKWNAQKKLMSKSRITGYKIKLATDKDFTKNVKNVTVKGYSEVSKKITNLKAKKKYFVKIRTYKVINSKYYYSKWSSYKTFTTKG